MATSINHDLGSLRCRICGNALFDDALLRFENMPKSAQWLPDINSVEEDCGIDLEVYQCSGCGLIQLCREPVPYYKEVIRATAFSKEMTQFREKQFSSFLNRFELNRSDKKLIEIGCGRGEYLKLLNQFNLCVQGLEWSDSSVAFCNHTGLKVAKGFIDHADDIIEGAPFDSFIMMSFLEHLPNPNATLRGIYNNLSEKAVGMIEVPDYDMICKKRLFSEFIPDHLSYFTRKTIRLVLELNGFDLLSCDTVWHDYIISVVIEKSPKQDAHLFIEEQNRIKKELQSYVSKFSKRRVAVWGAGHQALALLALTETACHIKYIVDSAPFKQGKYSPATHIPIVNPSFLKNDPVDAVVVMAGSYSEEVVTILKNHYPCNNIAAITSNGLTIIRESQ
ncbi:class I SAM-dependent methyltransferase [Desulfatirhabdium butyrativorans]|uniref:class I SAM-dependent methyltransferase n=1 Tax=Desulfatirhabdium butyrativorans TaxID=340467 RepID=UPI000557E417|nr:class I SAM-dependent methyltransferase [Desulfatirhabdium butyrativorans]